MRSAISWLHQLPKVLAVEHDNVVVSCRIYIVLYMVLVSVRWNGYYPCLRHFCVAERFHNITYIPWTFATNSPTIYSAILEAVDFVSFVHATLLYPCLCSLCALFFVVQTIENSVTIIV